MVSEPHARSANPATILVVDPDERVYKTFGAILSSKYHLVFTPSEALGKLIIYDFPFSMVFVGQNSATHSDGSLIRTLKTEHPSIPIVVIAKNPTAGLILSAFRAGARDIITFPIDPEELVYITERIDALRSTIRPTSTPHTPVPRFNLKHLWSQLRPANRGYVEIGIEEDERVSSLNTDSGAGDSGIADRLRRMPAEADGVSWKPFGRARSPEESADMRIYFLGQLRTIIDGREFEEWPSKKGKSLFAYISYHSDKPIFRDVLMDVFWPKSMAESARNSLNVVIHGLRKRLQQFDPAREYIVFKNECYSINPDLDTWTDVGELRALWREARTVEKRRGLGAAVDLFEQMAAIYRGDFMSDEIYEDWSALERENLKEIFLVALEKISENRFCLGQVTEAISICNEILERDSCREEIYRRLMCCYQRTGRRDKALIAYRKCLHALKSELDIGPSAATAELYRKIKVDAPNPCPPPALDSAIALPKAR